MNNKTSDEVIDALERLQRLKNSGLLSDDEFAQQKAKILKTETSPQPDNFGKGSVVDPVLSVGDAAQANLSESRTPKPDHVPPIPIWVGAFFVVASLISIAIYASIANGSANTFGNREKKEEAPVEIITRKESYTNYFSQLKIPPTAAIRVVDIQATIDEVELLEVIVNRGNCEIYERPMTFGSIDIDSPELPKTLKFGEKISLNLADCNIREIEVTTAAAGSRESFFFSFK